MYLKINGKVCLDTWRSMSRPFLGQRSSRAREFHPHPLTEPCVKVSPHTALHTQRFVHRHNLEEDIVVFCIFKDALAVDAAHHDMINSCARLDAAFPWHDTVLFGTLTYVKYQGVKSTIEGKNKTYYSLMVSESKRDCILPFILICQPLRSNIDNHKVKGTGYPDPEAE